MEAFRNRAEPGAALTADSENDCIHVEEADDLILTVVGQVCHGNFARLRKTRQEILAESGNYFKPSSLPDDTATSHFRSCLRPVRTDSRAASKMSSTCTFN